MSTKSTLDLRALNANKNIDARNYWKNRLSDLELNSYFGASHNLFEASAVKAYKKYSLIANEQIAATLKSIAGSKKAQHIILLAVLGILAQKCSDVDESVICSPLYNDDDTGAGVIPIVPVRMTGCEGMNFPAYITNLRDNLLVDFSYGDYPLDKILSGVSTELQAASIVGMTFEELHNVNAFDALSSDIIFHFSFKDTLELTITYNSYSFSAGYIQQIADLYFNLLKCVTADRERDLRDVELVSAEEKFKIINEFNNTRKDFPENQTLLDLFLVQVQKNPGNIAVKFRDEHLSYAELDRRSNQVANYLLKVFPGTNNIFAVHLDRSLELMIAIFGILKAGGAYLPLSKSHPKERLEYIMKNSLITAVFSRQEDSAGLPSGFTCIDLNKTGYYSSESVNRARPSDIAYIIYTSGSTGKPKGVLIKHRSVVNRLNWMQNTYNLQPGDNILQKTPVVFDVSVWELFWGAMYGATLVLAEPGIEKDPLELCKVIDKEKITVLHFVPSMLNALMVYLTSYNSGHTLKSIEHLFTSGEELKVTDAQLFLNYCPEAQLHNLYGPTEATVDVSFHPVSRSKEYQRIPIGKPIDNTTLLIFNKNQQVQPIGLSGELYIGGENLSPGYLNQEELTKMRFVENPLDKNSILYRTGDLARWLPDGNIEFLGRLDNQVKIRGNRIELGEIEFAINSFQGIKKAVVLAKESNGALHLIGFILHDPDFNEEELRGFLMTKLPEYMIPSYFISIQEIPVTVNGKINTKYLLELQRTQVNQYVAPGSALECSLATQWAGILKTADVGINDSFFRIGGDSILAVKLIGLMNFELGLNISMTELYENDTIKRLAAFIEALKSDDTADRYREIDEQLKQFNIDYQERVKDDRIEVVYPMTDIEKAMCFVHKSRPDDVLYFEQLLQPVLYHSLDIENMQKAHDMLVQKHEILRTAFDIDEFAHIIYKDVRNNIRFFDLSSLTAEEQKQRISDDLERSRLKHFDLSSAPLWRVIVYKLQPDHHEVLFEYHHAIIDGWSFASLLTEFNNTYGSLTNRKEVQLEVLDVKFKDYIAQELFYKTSRQTINFWKQELYGYKKLRLNEIPGKKVFKSVRGPHPDITLDSVEKIAGKYNTTAKNILLSAYIYAMKTLSCNSDVLVGLVTFTRPLKKDGEKLLGCFLNTIPLRVIIPEQITWAGYVSLIDKKILQLKKHEHLSLFEINQAIGSRDLGENPLFDTFFNFLNWHVRKDMVFEESRNNEVERIDFDTFLRGNTFFDVNYDVSNGTLLCMHEYSSPFMTEEVYGQYVELFNLAISKMEQQPAGFMEDETVFWSKQVEELSKGLIDGAEHRLAVNKVMPATSGDAKTWLSTMGPSISARKDSYIPLIVEFEGELDILLLEKSIGSIIDKYDILRTRFFIENDIVFKEVVPYNGFNLIVKELHGIAIQDQIDLSIYYAFEPEAMLFSSTLFKLRENYYKLIIAFHKAIVDNFSVSLLGEELISVYNLFLRGKTPGLLTTSLPYASFALWKEQCIQKLKTYLLSYWKKQLGTGVEHYQLPGQKAVTSDHTYSYASEKIHFSKEIVDKIYNYSEQTAISADIILMAAFTVLLFKYIDNEEIVIGVPVDNRNRDVLKQLVGNVSDYVAINSLMSSEKCFNEYTSALNETYCNALMYQPMPLDLITEELIEKNDRVNRKPFDILFEYHDKEIILPSIENLKVELSAINPTLEKIELNLFLKRNGKKIDGEFMYNTNSFAAETMSLMVERFSRVLDGLLSNAEERISRISLLDSQEQNLILNTFNNTVATFPSDKTIIDLFEEQVMKTPENIAIRHSNNTISYRKLADMVNNITGYLTQIAGIKTGDIVGLMLEREEYLIPVIYGILKAGAAYIPIDPGYPEERVNTILENSGTKVLITRGSLLSANLKNKTRLIDLDQAGDMFDAGFDKLSHIKLHPGNLAYIIYTSGSSGQPKGVMIEHHSLVNIIYALQNKYPTNEHDVYLLKTNYCFDVSVAEIFGWFLNGGSVSILPLRAEADSLQILNAIERDYISHINFVPSLFTSWVDALERSDVKRINSLKYIFLAGEALPKDLVNRFISLNTGVALKNIYGPTEGTIYSCEYAIGNVAELSKIPIGKPLANIKLYILNKTNQMQPVGIPGELCIAGEGVARGYLNNQALTSEKFVPDPFMPGSKMYKTGDLACWQLDGNIDFLGRIDDQVKIRGLRIELGEIESLLRVHDQVRECTVLVKEKDGDKYLVVYFVSPDIVDTKKLSDYLSSLLPDYMVPGHFIQLPVMPLNASGKINRKALPEIEWGEKDTYEGPSDEIEEKLVAIWSDVLNLNKASISINSSFFELGGHSLKAMTLGNYIFKELSIEIPAKEIFKMQTIKQQADFIKINEWLNKEDHSVVESIEIII